MEGDGGLPELHVLLLEDDPADACTLRRALLAAEAGVRVTVVPRLGAALQLLHDGRAGSPGCVVTELRLPDADGVRVVQALRAAGRRVPVIVVAADGSEELAVAALKGGAADYVRKHPGLVAELPARVREVLGRSVLAAVDDAHAGAPDDATNAVAGLPLVATTPNMRGVLALVERAVGSAVPVLIEGETGTGKELIARAVHQRGPRRQAPFLVQNCAAIAESLLESELFGHVRGAFTGAERERRGLFEEAGGGTVLLDEIAEAPPAVQAKLLRVLQHDEVKMVGANAVRRVQCRIVAATNRPLDDEVRAGRFRADLYYRLVVLPIRIPPLRHRTADVPALAAHFLRRAEAREGHETAGLDADALGALVAYPWPGNVRELENEIHRLVLTVGHRQRIRRHHLAPRIRNADTGARAEPLQRILARVELALIAQRLRESPTKSAAARSLGITREALYAKMRRLGLPTRDHASARNRSRA